jgi:hypothetical protein
MQERTVTNSNARLHTPPRQWSGTVRGACLALATALIALANVPGRAASDLFFDDFSRFPPGVLTAPIGQLNAAIQEYH